MRIAKAWWWILIAVIFLVLVFVVAKWLRTPRQNLDQLSTTAFTRSWNPATGLLEIKLGSQEAGFLLDPKFSQIIISVSADQRKRDERILLVRSGFWWEKAFCPGDQVSFQLSELDIAKMNKGELTKPIKISNLGPRSCAMNQ